MTGVPFPEPTAPRASRAEVLLGYLDFFRGVVVEKIDGLPDEQLRGSVLPSGWSPLALVSHLTSVESRWVVWGFAGEEVPDPWGDERDGRWTVRADEPAEHVVAALQRQAARTREVVSSHDLTDRGRPGERWDGAPPAVLKRVLLHLVQEYARHAGHLDVVRELLDGRTGESAPPATVTR